MNTQILTEHLSPVAAALREQRTGQNLFLNGIMMQSEQSNGNGRNYPRNEIEAAVRKIQETLAAGNTICGELEHPDNLTINLANVSHIITEAWMDGNNAMGKMKILNTPSGNIVRGLVEGGVRLGVSSRGSGNVNESGKVSGFEFLTVDVVATPSAPDAFPNAVMEAMNIKRVQTLAEQACHDPAAQVYFKREMKAFIETMFNKK